MNASRSCARALNVSHCARTAIKPGVSVRCHSTASPKLQAPPSLYLDFLAPSWQSTRPRTSALQRHHVSRASQSITPQRRMLCSTPSRHAKAITNPRKDDDGNEIEIKITPRASHRLKAIAEKDGNPDLALRVAVESGGCHGFQYLMSLVNVSDADAQEDTIFENEEKGEGYKPKVVMDEPSLELLKGSSVDYTMELIGSQFKVTGIPGAKSSCGCGTSFDIA